METPKVIIKSSQFPRELLEKAYREIEAKKEEALKREKGA